MSKRMLREKLYTMSTTLQLQQVKIVNNELFLLFVLPTMPHQVSSPTSIHPILLLSYRFISTSTRDYEEANVQWRIKVGAGLLF